MSQGPLCPNLSQKVQKEVSQMANRNLSHVILLGGLSVNLNHLKMEFWRIYFNTSILVLGSNFKIQMAENRCLTFWTSVKLTLNGPANGSEVTYSKIQNRLSRAP